MFRSSKLRFQRPTCSHSTTKEPFSKLKSKDWNQDINTIQFTCTSTGKTFLSRVLLKLWTKSRRSSKESSESSSKERKAKMLEDWPASGMNSYLSACSMKTMYCLRKPQRETHILPRACLTSTRCTSNISNLLAESLEKRYMTDLCWMLILLPHFISTS